ncbi:MAG TPA: hypothetical protein VLA89_07235 [Gemmatimonadales bacterium]|nr:hypothetical protein [Gemmatimonadales bacterium]
MVKKALEAELKKLPEDIQNGAEAKLALSLAQTIDHDATSATAKANLAKVLVEVIDRLRSLAPSEEEEDELARIRKRIAAA